MKVIKEIEKIFNSGVRYEFEPEVSSCRTICVKFILDVQEFKKGAVRKLVRGNYMEKNVTEMFKEFVKSMLEDAISDKVGSLEEEDCIVRIIA
jgi:hypothetical protein